MPDERRCPSCGEALSADAPAGLCVKCLLGLGLPGPPGAHPSPAAATTAEGNAPGATAALPPLATAPAQQRRAPSEQPGDRIGPYKLLQQIGEGGMGIVWMAEQTESVRRMNAAGPATVAVGDGLSDPNPNNNALTIPALTVGPPVQEISKGMGYVDLSWISDTGRLVPQIAPRLIGPPTWTTLTNGITTVDDRKTLRVPATAASRFFRLFGTSG